MPVDWRAAVGVSVLVALAACYCHGELAAQEPHLQLTEDTVHVNDVDVFYRAGGSGPPLLLIHAFTFVGHDWDRYLDEFGREYTVIVPDLRGHGRSSIPSEFGYRESARDMLALLDHLGISRTKGIGIGAGGCTLLRMASLQPSRVEAMIIVGGGHRLTPDTGKLARAIPRFENLPEDWREYNRRFQPGGEAQARWILSQLRALANSKDDYDLSPEELSAVPARTLLVWGDRDEWHPIETVVELYAALPDAQLWVVPGQSHHVLWPWLGGSQLAADIFPKLALEFLAKTGTQ